MELRPISKVLQEKCVKELNEKPERLVSDIRALREWLQKQPYLQNVNPSKLQNFNILYNIITLNYILKCTYFIYDHNIYINTDVLVSNV